ncbi:MAG: DUF3240 family protein [Burkholderiaceae bacterium]|jgi:hypothetical protein|nr:DUF3240 family protein [Burkholderiaceae bacterium]
MPSPPHCLHLVFPADLEEAVSAALIEHQPPLSGFTLLKAEGHSNDFATASPDERVRGRVARRVILMVQPLETIEAIITMLRTRVRSERVVWWTTRIEHFGRLK